VESLLGGWVGGDRKGGGMLWEEDSAYGSLTLYIYVSVISRAYLQSTTFCAPSVLPVL
jgi:hypothetical protein